MSENPVVSPFSYSGTQTPAGYECGGCGTSGVRLYREYQVFARETLLRCRECACRNQGREPSGTEHGIGWLVAAVPTEDGETYWGFTSVPQAGVEWWDRLPKKHEA